MRTRILGMLDERVIQGLSRLPGFSRVPVLGGLFRSRSQTKNRTELVMFITPRVVEGEADLKGTIEDLRRRMQQIDDTFDVFRRAKAPDAYSDAPGAPLPAPAVPGAPPQTRP